MNRRLLAVFLIWSTALASQAQGPGSFDAESKVRALERLWGEAAQLRDIKALDSIFDDSLVYVHIGGGVMTKAEVLADTKNGEAVNIVVESSDARAHGDLVIVTGILRLKGVDGGKPYLRHGRFVDTWLNKKGSWVCIGSLTTQTEH